MTPRPATAPSQDTMMAGSACGPSPIWVPTTHQIPPPATSAPARQPSQIRSRNPPVGRGSGEASRLRAGVVSFMKVSPMVSDLVPRQEGPPRLRNARDMPPTKNRRQERHTSPSRLRRKEGNDRTANRKSVCKSGERPHLPAGTPLSGAPDYQVSFLSDKSIAKTSATSGRLASPPGAPFRLLGHTLWRGKNPTVVWAGAKWPSLFWFQTPPRIGEARPRQRARRATTRWVRWHD